MYVVGFLGSDDSLGRTYLCQDHAEAMRAMKLLAAEQSAVLPDDPYWENNCTFVLDGDTFFYGSLETPS